LPHFQNVSGEFFQSVIAGALTGAAGALVGSPFFQVKVRLQSLHRQNAQMPGCSVGYQHSRYTGIVSGFKCVLREEGPEGLMRGARAAMLRVAVGSATQLSCYGECKKRVSVSWGLTGTPLHVTASLITSFAVVSMMNPFDVISTRLYNAPPGRYSGIAQCARATLEAEGLAAMYKGWTAHYCRLGPHTILTFVCWEKAKELADHFLGQYYY